MHYSGAENINDDPGNSCQPEISEHISPFVIQVYFLCVHAGPIVTQQNNLNSILWIYQYYSPFFVTICYHKI